MPAPLALIFGEVLLGGLLLDRGVKDVRAALPGGSDASAPAGQLVGGTTPVSGSASGGTAGDQKSFGDHLAQLSGLSPSFVNAWLLHEQPPGSPATPGSNNWLNVGYTDSGPDATYFSIAGMDPQQAAAATWQWLQANQPSIGAAAGKSLATQVTALENSGWASSHYGNQSPSQFLSV